MKLNIRKKFVSLAVASAVTGGAMMAIPAQAMNVSQNQVGQVLLFPYYSVQSGYDTLLSVVNTSAKTAVFKVRWRESINSLEVRDFNVILSPHDVWNGAVTVLGDGSTGFRTYDKSCTSPELPGMVGAARAVDGAKGEVAFASIGDNRQGYFEIILMGVADSTNTGTAVDALRAGSLHAQPAGVPNNCVTVDNLFATDVSILALNNEMSAPENILKGSLTFINVTHGVSFNSEPTAIENFQTGGPIVFAPGDNQPDLADGDDLATIHYLENGTPSSIAVPGGSEDAVSALLSMGSIANEYASGTNAATSWVVTMPTKHHYASSNTCYDISMSLYNREERTTVILDNTQFSPFVPGDQTVNICPESVVFDFNDSPIFGTASNHKGVDTTTVGLNGWVNLTFLESIDNGTSLAGLPVIGFSTIVRDSADATVNYGNAYEFAGQRRSILVP